jgi:hypothetical protein
MMATRDLKISLTYPPSSEKILPDGRELIFGSTSFRYDSDIDFLDHCISITIFHQIDVWTMPFLQVTMV